MQYLIYLSLLINYSDIEYRPLTWEDFKMAAPKSSFTAETTTVLELSYSGTEDSIHFKVSCHFLPGESWTNTNDSAKLLHENLHFSISYLYYLRSMRILLPFQGTSQIKQASLAYERNAKEWTKTERKYDMETNHSRDISAQLRWERYIKQKLKELE